MTSVGKPRGYQLGDVHSFDPVERVRHFGCPFQKRALELVPSLDQQIKSQFVVERAVLAADAIEVGVVEQVEHHREGSVVCHFVLLPDSRDH